MMRVVKKLKSLFVKKDQQEHGEDSPSTAKHSKQSFESIDNPIKIPEKHPISSKIVSWAKKNDWKYEHRKPQDDDLQKHYVILGFADQECSWTCAFRVREDNHLVTIFGILDDNVPQSHYMPVLVELTKANLSINYGNIELDLSDGEVRAKFSFDAEFSLMSEQMLDCSFTAVLGLVKLASSIVKDALEDKTPSSSLEEYLSLEEELENDELLLISKTLQ